jgi:hypothetical protein
MSLISKPAGNGCISVAAGISIPFLRPEIAVGNSLYATAFRRMLGIFRRRSSGMSFDDMVAKAGRAQPGPHELGLTSGGCRRRFLSKPNIADGLGLAGVGFHHPARKLAFGRAAPDAQAQIHVAPVHFVGLAVATEVGW